MSKENDAVEARAEAAGDGKLRHDRAFSYRLFGGSERVPPLVLLHGSGVDETTLVPFARTVSPQSRLLAVRGRVPQEGGWRWFERITPTRFGQDSIRHEAADFAAFLDNMSQAHGITMRKAIFLGYSNGANLISSVMLLFPGLIERAILLRAMPVLDEQPSADLSGSSVLVISGAADATYGPYRSELVDMLRQRHAAVESHTVPLGHEFGEPDAELIRSWLEGFSG